MKFVSPITEGIEKQLRHLNNTSPISRVRDRALAIILSAKKFPINQLSEIFDVGRNAVSDWIDNWEQLQFKGLYDAPRSGRPKSVSDNMQNRALEIILEEPRQIKTSIARIQQELGETVRLHWVKRLLKTFKYRWKRVRKSLKSKRNQQEFDKAQEELKALQELADRGVIDLRYFDQTGFTLIPVVPYAWQKVNERILLLSSNSTRLNVLGFFNQKNELTPYMFDGSVDSDVVIACMDDFCSNITKKTVVIIDNASVHTSDKFNEKIPQWEDKKMVIKYLPTYSPELNIIEKLWEHIKYYWLPLSAYLDRETLVKSVEEVLKEIGLKYTITFA